MIPLMGFARLYRDWWNAWGEMMVAAASGYSQPPKAWKDKP